MKDRIFKTLQVLILCSIIGIVLSCSEKSDDNTYQHKAEVQATSNKENQLKWKEVFNGEGRLMINEFMSNNQTYLLDKQGEAHDWLELYNGTKNTIQLDEYYLSDEQNNLQKWRFPSNLTLSPNEFLIVFASGKDYYKEGELHCNFSIKQKGESLYLSKGIKVIHSTPKIALNKDESYGYLPDGGNQGYIHSSPSAAQSNFNKYKDVVQFSHEGGIYEDTFSLVLKNSLLDYRIYFTLNGDDVDTNGYRYEAPLSIAKSINEQKKLSDVVMTPPDHIKNIQLPVRQVYSIKAAVFNSTGEKISPTSTYSYFIETLGNTHHPLPILSLNIPPKELTDYEKGLFVPGKYWSKENPKWTGNYYQRSINWERKAVLEFYTTYNENKIHQHIGIRVHGGNNRRESQKALRLYARSKYGSSVINHSFFPERPHQVYKQVVLRPFIASWTGAGFENKLANDLAQGLNIESTPTHPIIVYINGEYWGIYFIEERLNHHYFKSNFNVAKKDLEVIENWGYSAKLGSHKHFKMVSEFIAQKDLSLKQNYSQVSQWIDIDNFIDYQILQQFISNYDWPANNMRCWRDNKTNSKWRWLLFDGDGSFGDKKFNSFKHAIGENNKSWSADEKSTLFFRKLIENEAFKQQFFDRRDELYDKHFSYARTFKIYNDLLTKIQPHIKDQVLRHQKPESLEKWSDTTQYINEFLKHRAKELTKMTDKYFKN